MTFIVRKKKNKRVLRTFCKKERRNKNESNRYDRKSERRKIDKEIKGKWVAVIKMRSNAYYTTRTGGMRDWSRKKEE